MLFSGSSITGQSPPCSSKNARASSALSSKVTRQEHGVAVGAVGDVEGVAAPGAPRGTGCTSCAKKFTHHPAAAVVVDRHLARRRCVVPAVAGASSPISGLCDGALGARVAGGQHRHHEGDEHGDRDRRDRARSAGRRPGSLGSSVPPASGRHALPTGSGTGSGSASGSGASVDGDRRRRGIGRHRRRRPGPRGQHRAEGHHAAADPEPDGHRLDDHAERHRRAAVLGQADDREVHVLAQAGLHRRGADERRRSPGTATGPAVHLAAVDLHADLGGGAVALLDHVGAEVGDLVAADRRGSGPARSEPRPRAGSGRWRRWPRATITTPRCTIMPPLVRPTNPRQPCRRVASTTWRTAAPPAKPPSPKASTVPSPRAPSATATTT